VGILTRRLELAGDKGREETVGLFDTGASYSFIRPDVAERLATLLPLVQPLRFETAQEGDSMTATQRVVLDFLLNDYRFSDEFIVLDRLSEPVIIGAATMQKWRMKLDMEREEVVIDPSVTRLRLI
jgi:hypothetical protein